MTMNEITEGHWTYQISWTGCTATRQDGAVIDCVDIVDARRKTYEYDRAQPAAVTITYTIAGGPQRARAGHQRYTKAHMEAA